MAYTNNKNNQQGRFAQDDEFEERTVHINRVAKVVKGGRRFSFSAIVVVGDGKGKVGIGKGKAAEVPEAIRKGNEKARRDMQKIPVINSTIPHEIIGRYGASKVVLKPASPGTGIIAGGTVRAIVESVGIDNILTKIIGSRNPHNVVLAVMNGLTNLMTKEQFAKRLGKTVEQVEQQR